MRRLTLSLGLVLLASGVAAEANFLRLVVADLPYPRVWGAIQESVHGYPIERAADGVIVTGWRDRAPGAHEKDFERVGERLTLRVDAFGERITRITLGVELRGWRDGHWVMIEEVGPAARDVLARIRAALG